MVPADLSPSSPFGQTISSSQGWCRVHDGLGEGAGPSGRWSEEKSLISAYYPPDISVLRGALVGSAADLTPSST